MHNISKLLHISSDEDDIQNQQPVSNSNLPNSKSKLTKLNSFKGDLYSMQQNNNFNYSNNNEKQYIYQQNINHKFTLLDHSIQLQTKNREAQYVHSKSQNQTIISHLNNLNLANQNQQTAKKNLFDLDFDEDEDEDEDDHEDQNKDEQDRKQQSVLDKKSDKVEENIFGCQQIEELGVNDGNQRQQKQIEETAIIIKKQNQTATQFSLMNLNSNDRIMANLIRLNSGIDYFLPRFDLILKHDLFTILSCKKQMGTKFEYWISTDKNNFCDKSESFMGKIVGNFKNSVFSLIDKTDKRILCTCRFRQEEQINASYPLMYQAFILNEGQNYNDLVGKDINMDRGLDELYQVPHNKYKIHYFRNRRPQKDKITKAFMLNFSQRVSQKSVKNFILEDVKSGREVLMFGKGPGETFNLQISAPLNVLVALTIILPQFASKMLVL